MAKLGHGAAVNLALYISQGGEFAFILFSAAASAQVLDRTLADLLIVVVSVSMTVTPLLVTLNEKIFKIGHGADKPEEFDKIEAHEHRVIIAGFGRFGQMVARTLRENPYGVERASAGRLCKFGNKIYSATPRVSICYVAHAESADVFVLAIDDIEASIKTALMVKNITAPQNLRPCRNASMPTDSRISA
jgi:glutathione-regulated potassium-efflux system ancillary protein KefC/glutathione-regulated potassium-efflux system protein KefB